MKLLVFILAIFALGACEEVVYRDVVRTLRDTVKLPGEKDTVYIIGERKFEGLAGFISADTTDLDICVVETDTFYIVTIDSVFIYEADTVFKVTQTFRDTFPYFPTRTVYFVPAEVQPIVNAFYAECQARGILVSGGNLFVTLWPDDDFPPSNRSSRTFTVWAHGQWVIEVVSWVDYPHYFTPIFRELAHIQLGKPYTNDPDNIMNPAFDPFKLTLQSPEAQYYIDKLFAN